MMVMVKAFGGFGAVSRGSTVCAAVGKGVWFGCYALCWLNEEESWSERVGAGSMAQPSVGARVRERVVIWLQTEILRLGP